MAIMTEADGVEWSGAIAARGRRLLPRVTADLQDAAALFVQVSERGTPHDNEGKTKQDIKNTAGGSVVKTA